MLIDRETACKPYGTLFAVLHHPYFPAVVSNSLTLLQPYLGDNQGVTFVLIISLMLYSIKRNPSERIADQCVQTRPPKLTWGPAGTLGADTFGKVLHTCLPKKKQMLFFVINSYCKTKPACCDLPCSAILLRAAGTAGEQEGFCELCPIGVQGEPPTFCSAAHCPSCTCSLCFCNVLSKLGCNLETGRMCFGCAQNQEFQISSKSDKGASHFPLSRWKGLLP